jgi:hypothetical protein
LVPRVVVPPLKVHADAEADGIHDLHRAREMLSGIGNVLVQIDQPLLFAPVVGGLGSGGSGQRKKAQNRECGAWNAFCRGNTRSATE